MGRRAWRRRDLQLQRVQDDHVRRWRHARHERRGALSPRLRHARPGPQPQPAWRRGRQSPIPRPELPDDRARGRGAACPGPPDRPDPRSSAGEPQPRPRHHRRGAGHRVSDPARPGRRPGHAPGHHLPRRRLGQRRDRRARLEHARDLGLARLHGNGACADRPDGDRSRLPVRLLVYGLIDARLPHGDATGHRPAPRAVDELFDRRRRPEPRAVRRSDARRRGRRAGQGRTIPGGRDPNPG